MGNRMEKRSNQSKHSHSSQASLRIEQLEQRMMLNGDNTLGLLADVSSEDTTVQFSITSPLLRVLPVDEDAIDIEWTNPFPSPNPLPDMPQGGFQSAAEARAWVINAIDTQYGHFFETSVSNQYPQYFYWLHDPISLTFNDDAGITEFLTNSFTGTNVQVEGVDEADLIETDGEYLYLVSGKELIVVDARDSENLSIASRIQLNERPTGIYLSGDRLTLISTGRNGYNSSWGYQYARGATTTVTVLDLEDRTAPTQAQKTEFQGQLVSSRMVDGQLRLVMNQSMNYQSSYQSRFYLSTPRSSSALNEATGLYETTYESRSEYMDRELENAVSRLLPSSLYRTFSADGTVIDQDWSVPSNALGGQLSARIIIATLDVLGDDAGPVDIETLRTGNATEVYATENSLYVFEESGSRRNSETTIHKFDFDADDHSIQLVATGKVAGAMLNQFSADEHDGYLRVVTESRRLGQSLIVLEQVGNELKMVGSVNNLAPGETLHSVRFMGEQAFVVTFQKVDPLFAIDLRDPTNPTVAGELKIPGYSDYLQPLGEGFLLGIGRDADVRGGLFREMQLSIFNVSDLDNPQLAQRFSLEGGRSTASIAVGGRWTQGDGDHHAVSYFATEQILALPIHSEGNDWRASRNGIDNTPIFEQGEGGLQLFSVSTETGFESLGIIEHDSPILRSLQIDGTLFAFSAGEISTHGLGGSIEQLDSLQLLVGSDTGLVELTDLYTAPATPDAAGIRATVSSVATRIDRGAFVPTALPQSPSQQAVVKALLSASFGVPSVDTIDSVFSSEDLAGAEDLRLSLDDLLMDDFLADFLGQKD